MLLERRVRKAVGLDCVALVGRGIARDVARHVDHRSVGLVVTAEVPTPVNIYVNLGVWLAVFRPLRTVFSGSWRPFPESCGKDGGNGEKTGEKRAKMGEKWPKKSGGKLT